MRKQVIGFVMALAVMATACGKSDPKSPLTPSTSAAPAPGTGSAMGSASIAGTVLTGSSALSLRPAGGSLTVSIVGTSISATIDASGRFTLQNVPSGDLTLAFSGSGHDARITITGVGDREQIRITVNLGANGADLDDDEREKADHGAEVEGRIVSVSCGAASSSMVVGQMTQTMVLIPAGITIRHGDTALSCSQLTVGLRVHVKGVKNGAVVTATEIQVQGNPGPPASNEVEIEGTVSAIASRSCATNAVTFTVMASGTPTMVTTSASTKFEGTTCAALAVNDKVEVKGTRQGGGVLASKVEGDGKDDDDDDDRDGVELKGALGAWDASKCATGVSSTVAGKPFSTTPATKFDDTTCAALKAGDIVEVKGARSASGSVVAARVEKKR